MFGGGPPFFNRDTHLGGEPREPVGAGLGFLQQLARAADVGAKPAPVAAVKLGHLSEEGVLLGVVRAGRVPLPEEVRLVRVEEHAGQPQLLRAQDALRQEDTHTEGHVQGSAAIRNGETAELAGNGARRG